MILLWKNVFFPELECDCYAADPSFRHTVLIGQQKGLCDGAASEAKHK